MNYIASGKKQGAKLLSGGKRHGDRGYFVEPTVFAGVKDEHQIACEEIFGPVLSVIPFKSIDDVVERGNRTMYGLAGAVWKRDITNAHRLAAELQAGPGRLNCHDV